MSVRRSEQHHNIATAGTYVLERIAKIQTDEY